MKKIRRSNISKATRIEAIKSMLKQSETISREDQIRSDNIKESIAEKRRDEKNIR